jgi:hypothetical protein
MTLFALASACGSDATSSTTPADAASEASTSEAGVADSMAAPDAVGDVHANPNNVEDGSVDATADATTEAAVDAAKDVTLEAMADVANDVATDASADVTLADVVAQDVATESAADVMIADVASDAPVDAPMVDVNVLDAFPDTGIVIPDAANGSGGSTAACTACALTSCPTQLEGCVGDVGCTNTEKAALACLDVVDIDSATISGCLTSLSSSADVVTLALGICLVTSCPTPCGVPIGFDAGL